MERLQTYKPNICKMEGETEQFPVGAGGFSAPLWILDGTSARQTSEDTGNLNAVRLLHRTDVGLLKCTWTDHLFSHKASQYA